MKDEVTIAAGLGGLLLGGIIGRQIFPPEQINDVAAASMDLTKIRALEKRLQSDGVTFASKMLSPSDYHRLPGVTYLILVRPMDLDAVKNLATEYLK